MNPDAALSPLQQALSLSAQMREMAEQGDWDQVQAMHQRCDQLLREGPTGASDMHALRQLQDDQQAVLALATGARQAVADALAMHRSKHRAVSAYLVADNA